MKKLFNEVVKSVKHTVPLAYVTGSRLYGAFTETSDYDVRGFYTPTAEELLLQKKTKVFDMNTVNSEGVKTDFTFPSVADFCRQLVKNPNYAELFDKDVVLLNDKYDLHSKADWFVSQVLLTSVCHYFKKENALVKQAYERRNKTGEPFTKEEKKHAAAVFRLSWTAECLFDGGVYLVSLQSFPNLQNKMYQLKYGDVLERYSVEYFDGLAETFSKKERWARCELPKEPQWDKVNEFVMMVNRDSLELKR